MPDPTVTLSAETIHNPDEPRHFMRIKPFPGLVQIFRDGELIASSRDALRLIEVGRDIYDPVMYLPRADVSVALRRIDKRTRCPLKGEAAHFRSTDGRGTRVWSYEDTLPFAAILTDRYAFSPKQVEIRVVPDPE